MTVQISTDGAQAILNALIGSAVNETLIMRLYSNNYTPSSVTTLADFTEVNGGGYTEKQLSVNDWTLNGNAITTNPQAYAFNASVGQVYGYYLVGASSGNLIASERFSSGPFNVATNGDTITVTATISVA